MKKLKTLGQVGVVITAIAILNIDNIHLIAGLIGLQLQLIAITYIIGHLAE